MIIEIDVRGLACPKPVINTKKQLDNMEIGAIRVITDNNITKENILKFATSSNYEYKIINQEDDLIVIEIIKGEYVEVKEKSKEELSNRCIFISSDKMGQGNDELGDVLMKGFIYTLTETKPYPKNIIFVNSAVKLTSINDDVIENLKILQNKGVDILSCGTCLDYYCLKDSLRVGSITNMYNIVEIMNKASQTISI